MISSASIPSHLINEVISLGVAPLLKKHGYRKIARHFFRQSATSTCHLSFRASKWNTAEQASFTVDVWTYHPAIAIALGESPIEDPEKQRFAHCGLGIGHLLPQPGDFWWPLESADQVPRIAEELTTAIKEYALPYLDRAATLEGIAELSGYIPAICNDPTEAKAVALRLLGREQEAIFVEAALARR